jgi:hypothetical protein
VEIPQYSTVAYGISATGGPISSYFWAPLDNALRAAALTYGKRKNKKEKKNKKIEGGESTGRVLIRRTHVVLACRRNVTVQILIGDAHSEGDARAMPFVQSLALVPGISVRIFSLPQDGIQTITQAIHRRRMFFV